MRLLTPAQPSLSAFGKHAPASTTKPCATVSISKAGRRIPGSSSPCPAASTPRPRLRCLKSQGYDVVGITLQLYDHGAATHRKGACCAGQDIHDARNVAERIGIPHYVLDYEERFRESVIDSFAESYAAGETPVPCIECNRSVKFRDLLVDRARARRAGARDRPLRVVACARRRIARAALRGRCRSRPELFPVCDHARAARLHPLSARRHDQARGARAGAALRPRRSPTSTTARTSASCRPAATPTSSAG